MVQTSYQASSILSSGQMYFECRSSKAAAVPDKERVDSVKPAAEGPVLHAHWCNSSLLNYFMRY